MSCESLEVSFSEKIKKLYDNLVEMLNGLTSLSDYKALADETKELATTKASEASTSATTATEAKNVAVAKANEASTSATTATEAKDVAVAKASEASASATTATEAKNVATTKATEAIALKDELLAISSINVLSTTVDESGHLIFDLSDTSNITASAVDENGHLIFEYEGS